MSQDSNHKEKIKRNPLNNFEILKIIATKLSKIIRGKRNIMYSDIINLIIREGYIGKKYDQLILWCNYKIRLGETYVDLE
ncbi:MAG: hypothetical protein ACFE75_05730 [Candidatus Hodarchaeota archaeon]